MRALMFLSANSACGLPAYSETCLPSLLPCEASSSPSFSSPAILRMVKSLLEDLSSALFRDHPLPTPWGGTRSSLLRESTGISSQTACRVLGEGTPGDTRGWKGFFIPEGFSLFLFYGSLFISSVCFVMDFWMRVLWMMSALFSYSELVRCSFEPNLNLVCLISVSFLSFFVSMRFYAFSWYYCKFFLLPHSPTKSLVKYDPAVILLYLIVSTQKWPYLFLIEEAEAMNFRDCISQTGMHDNKHSFFSSLLSTIV